MCDKNSVSVQIWYAFQAKKQSLREVMLDFIVCHQISQHKNFCFHFKREIFWKQELQFGLFFFLWLFAYISCSLRVDQWACCCSNVFKLCCLILLERLSKYREFWTSQEIILVRTFPTCNSAVTGSTDWSCTSGPESWRKIYWRATNFIGFWFDFGKGDGQFFLSLH